jgi:CheY-like chemotaxis protein
MGMAARRSVLEELGHQVLTAGTAGEALELCGEHSFDVVVTDYKMPKMNGVELIVRLRKLHPATAVILISGFTDTLGLDEAGTGADIVLQKSNNEVPQLIRAVNRLLRKQQQPPKKPTGSQSGSKTEKRKTR